MLFDLWSPVLELSLGLQPPQLLLYPDAEAEAGKPQDIHPPLGAEPWYGALGALGQEALSVFQYSMVRTLLIRG